VTRGERALLALIVAAGAAIRFAGLGSQSWSPDEGVTVLIMKVSFGDLFTAVRHSESTPPLYYALAWVWAKVFGLNEAGLRSLSALAGSLTVPVAYLAGAALVTRRVGLVVAALAAFNPLLVWYSQEARAYALLVLLVTASFLFFVQRRLVWWAIVSALALATHYFAAFVIGPEAVWLAWELRRRALVPVGIVVAAGAALLPLAIEQRATGHTSWIGDIPLGQRIKEVPKKFLIGEQGSPGKYGSLAETLKFFGVAIVAAGAVLAITRTDPRERRGAIVAASIGAAGLALPLLLKLTGLDYFAAYNLQAVWIPLAIALAAGLGARAADGLGLALAAGLCAVFLATVLEVDANPTLQRYDFKGAARTLGRPARARAIVLSPQVGEQPLAAYVRGLEFFPLRGASVSEIDIVGMHSQDESTRRRALGPPPRPSNRAFRLAGRVDTDTFTIVRYRATRPMRTTLNQLVPIALGDPPPAVTLQRP
jgi:mannosyltransferase